MQSLNQAQVLFQKALTQQWMKIRIRNPQYSLRAFSRKAGISPSAMSEVLRGKRRISQALALKVAKKLCFDPNASLALMEAFEERPSGQAKSKWVEYRSLNMEHFQVISDWYHFAIRSLSETQGYRHDPVWIAKRLKIKTSEAKAALKRLESLGLMKVDAHGRVTHNDIPYTTSDDLADLSLRKVHAQNLDLARNSLENDDVPERDFTAITMAVDPAKLAQAKKMIREFRDRLCAFMESGEKTEVHKLCIQLIPLTKEKL